MGMITVSAANNEEVLKAYPALSSDKEESRYETYVNTLNKEFEANKSQYTTGEDSITSFLHENSQFFKDI